MPLDKNSAQVQALLQAAQKLKEASDALTAFSGQGTNPLPMSRLNVKYGESAVGSYTTELHGVVKICANLNGTALDNFLTTPNNFTYAQFERMKATLLEPVFNPSQQALDANKAKRLDEAAPTVGGAANVTTPELIPGPIATAANGQKDADAVIAAQQKIKEYRDAVETFEKAYLGVTELAAQELCPAIEGARVALGKSLGDEAFAFRADTVGKAAQIGFKVDENNQVSADALLQGKIDPSKIQKTNENGKVKYLLSFADQAAVDAFSKNFGAADQYDTIMTQLAWPLGIKDINAGKDASGAGTPGYSYKTITTNAAGTLCMKIELPGRDENAVRTWLQARLNETKNITATNYSFDVAQGQTQISDPNNPGQLKASPATVIELSFNTPEAGQKFSASLSTYWEKHVKAAKQTKNLGTALQAKLSQLSVELAHTWLDENNLSYRLVLRVPNEHEARVNSFFASTGRAVNCQPIHALPANTPDDAKKAHLAGSGTHKELALEFTTIDELNNFYERIETDRSIGYPMADLAYQTSPMQSATPSEAQEHLGLKTSLDTLAHNLSKGQTVRADRDIKETYNGQEKFLVLSFTADSAYFTPGTHNASSNYEKDFVKNLPEGSRDIAVYYADIPNNNDKKIHVLVKKSAAGREAAKNYLKNIKSPPAIKTATGGTPRSEYGMRAFRFLVSAVTLPFVIFAVAVAALPTLVMVLFGATNGKTLGQKLEAQRIQTQRKLAQATPTMPLGTWLRLHVSLAISEATRFMENMLLRWQETSFDLPGKNRKMQLLNSSSPLNRFIGIIMVLINIPVDLLSGIIFGIARTFGFDQNGRAEAMFKRGLTWAWSLFVLATLTVATVGAIGYVVAQILIEAGAINSGGGILGWAGNVASFDFLAEIPIAFSDPAAWITLVVVFCVGIVAAFSYAVYKSYTADEVQTTALNAPLLGDQATPANELQKAPDAFASLDSSVALEPLNGSSATTKPTTGGAPNGSGGASNVADPLAARAAPTPTKHSHGF